MAFGQVRPRLRTAAWLAIGDRLRNAFEQRLRA
jgi:hypothetical protein